MREQRRGVAEQIGRRGELSSTGLALLSAVFIAIAGGCSDSSSGGGEECSVSSDCSAGELCIRGECRVSSGNNGGSNNGDVGGGDGQDGDDGGVSNCPDAPEPAAGDLIFNEILAAVPTDEDLGDVNGDGARDASDDEFVEIVNLSDETLNIAGLQIFKDDGDEPEVVIRTGCLEAGRGLVVFGGLEEDASPPSFAEATVEIADGSLSLNNGGAALSLVTSGGDELVAVEYPGVSGQSAALDPQLEPGDTYVPHTELAEGALYSPGACPDGEPLSSGCPGPVDPCPDAAAPTGETLMVNEVLSAVPTGDVGDANGDGARSASDDEFIEFVNIGTETLRVEGLRIAKGDSQRTELSTQCLEAGQALVVFGGLDDGAMSPMLGDAVVEISGSTWGFSNNGGSLLRVLTPDDAEIISIELPAITDQSINRSAELDPEAGWVGHTELAPGMLFSPGSCAGGGSIMMGCEGGPGDVADAGDAGDAGDMEDVGDTGDGDVAPDTPPDPCEMAPAPEAGDLVLNEILSCVPTGDAGDANGDGDGDSGEDEFVELWNTTGELLRVEGVTIRKDDSVKYTFEGCIEPDRGVVVFGGLVDDASLPEYPDMTTVLADSQYQFSNGGGVVKVVAAGGDAEIVNYAFPGCPDPRASFSLEEELNPNSSYAPHTTDPEGALFSPGTCRDGSSLATGCQ